MRSLLIVFILTACSVRTSGQVIISLLLGDKLNSGKVEFGLDGGLSLADLKGVSPSKRSSALNLGFYFDIKLKNSWFLHTGVMVKSSMGAKDLAVYSVDDPGLDNLLTDAEVKRKLGYFNVPFAIKYRFRNNMFLEGGPMVSLINKCTDEFVATVHEKEDLTYKVDIRDQFHTLDAGFIGGIGYRLMGGNGMNLAIRYYVGLVDITIDDTTPDQYNRSLYFAVGIPIGVGK